MATHQYTLAAINRMLNMWSYQECRWGMHTWQHLKWTSVGITTNRGKPGALSFFPLQQSNWAGALAIEVQKGETDRACAYKRRCHTLSFGSDAMF